MSAIYSFYSENKFWKFFNIFKKPFNFEPFFYVTEKRTQVVNKRIEIPHLLTVLFSIPHTKLLSSIAFLLSIVNKFAFWIEYQTVTFSAFYFRGKEEWMHLFSLPLQTYCKLVTLA